MALEHYITKGGKKLRYGYTTGTCAALAAAAATRMLLTGETVESVSLVTPKGIEVDVPVGESGFGSREGDEAGTPNGDTMRDVAWAGIPKDAGDDSDITDGMLICARAERLKEIEEKEEREGNEAAPAGGSEGSDIFVKIDGGEGVGRVTKDGLDQPVGNAAINSGPRKMIEEQVTGVCRELGFAGGIGITVFVPGGEEAAKQTFNSNLGIEGGLSILGTTGIVEPMSEQALVDTIELEMKQDGLQTDCLILTPGNYGVHYIEEKGLDLLVDGKGVKIPVLKFSNFLGDTLDMLGPSGIRTVLLVGHAGKLVKVAGGIMNTHSSHADCRREIICSHAALSGADGRLAGDIMKGATTDACFDMLDEGGILPDVIESILGAIQEQLDHRVGPGIRIGAVLFSNIRGTLGCTEEAKSILSDWDVDKKGVVL